MLKSEHAHTRTHTEGFTFSEDLYWAGSVTSRCCGGVGGLGAWRTTWTSSCCCCGSSGNSGNDLGSCSLCTLKSVTSKKHKSSVFPVQALIVALELVKEIWDFKKQPEFSFSWLIRLIHVELCFPSCFPIFSLEKMFSLFACVSWWMLTVNSFFQYLSFYLKKRDKVHFYIYTTVRRAGSAYVAHLLHEHGSESLFLASWLQPLVARSSRL